MDIDPTILGILGGIIAGVILPIIGLMVWLFKFLFESFGPKNQEYYKEMGNSILKFMEGERQHIDEFKVIVKDKFDLIYATQQRIISILEKK